MAAVENDAADGEQQAADDAVAEAAMSPPPAAASVEASPTRTRPPPRSSSKTAQQRERQRALQEELGSVISLLSGCQGLGLKLDAPWALEALYTAVGRASSSGITQTALLQACSAPELAGLAAALAEMGAAPSEGLLEAYAQALWPKLVQLEPQQVLRVFNALVAWGYPFPAAMVASFSARLATMQVTMQLRFAVVLGLLQGLKRTFYIPPTPPVLPHTCFNSIDSLPPMLPRTGSGPDGPR